MRLAIVGPLSPWRGGIALHTAEMARGAAESGHAVRVVSFRRLYPAAVFPGRSQLEPGAAGARDLADRSLHRLVPWSPPSWASAARAVEAFAPDLVVLQRWHPFFQPALAFVAGGGRRAGATIAWMVHNAEPHEGGRLAWRAVARLGFRPHDVFLTHAASEAAKLRAAGVRGEVRVLRHPAPASLSAAADAAGARRALGVPSEEVVFLFLGYVRHYKGVDVLLDALARLPAAGPPWRAIVAGEWYVDRAAADAAVARAPLAGRVTLVDRYVPDGDLAPLLAAATVVVLPYRSGTQSGVVPLAFAHGRPVITTAVGGLADAVAAGETGLVVPPEDPVALAGALEEVRRGRRFSAEAIAAAHAAASWRTFVAALEGIATRSRERCPPPPVC